MKKKNNSIVQEKKGKEGLKWCVFDGVEGSYYKDGAKREGNSCKWESTEQWISCASDIPVGILPSYSENANWLKGKKLYKCYTI